MLLRSLQWIRVLMILTRRLEMCCVEVESLAVSVASMDLLEAHVTALLLDIWHMMDESSVHIALLVHNN